LSKLLQLQEQILLYRIYLTQFIILYRNKTWNISFIHSHTEQVPVKKWALKLSKLNNVTHRPLILNFTHVHHGVWEKTPREKSILGFTLCIDSKSKINTHKKDSLHTDADNLKYERHCKFWKSHSSEYEDNHLLACDVLCSMTFQRNHIIYPDNINKFRWNISTYLPDYICMGVDPGFVWPEAYTISGAPLKKLQIQN
jgi:hypothetical protein